MVHFTTVQAHYTNLANEDVFGVGWGVIYPSKGLGMCPHEIIIMLSSLIFSLKMNI